MDDERKEMNLIEQIVWYLKKLDERKLRVVLHYVFKLFVQE